VVLRAEPFGYACVVTRGDRALADDQIAAAMGVSTAKARGHIAKAMAALRAELQADGGALKIWQGEPG
jgi:DNA-directed RNA polymerase specialized sigma24 family protein